MSYVIAWWHVGIAGADTPCESRWVQTCEGSYPTEEQMRTLGSVSKRRCRHGHSIERLWTRMEPDPEGLRSDVTQIERLLAAQMRGDGWVVEPWPTGDEDGL